MRLPPGVTSADFSAVIKQFEAAIGKEWVFTSDEDVDLYRDAYSPLWHEEDEPIPSAAVAPDGIEQIQAILKIANAYKIPLWTISTGRNLGYGGSAPLLGGSVVLDLKRMNRVLEVNDKNHYALVEPGVSYFDLYRYIHERGLKVWLDPPDPGWGSPVGNCLERGGGYTPMHDHFDAVCGMEVVLANGEVVRTGMGALPGSKTWQQYKYGFGPYVTGMFSQSNFGIVTKMGIWLMPEPEAYLTGTVTVSKHDDLFPLVEIFANLVNSGTLRATTLLTSPLWFSPPNEELDALRYSGSVQGLEDYARRKNIPYWSVPLPFYGPAKVIAAQWEYAKEKFSSIPGVKFEDGPSYRFPLSADQLAKMTDTVPFGIPSLQIFSIMGPHGQGHLGFSPIIPMTGEAVLESQKVFTQVYRDLGSPGGSATTFPIFSFFARAFVNIYLFPIEHDVEKNRKTREIYRRLIKESAARGWGEYRTHTTFMGDISDTYSFNNHALRHFHETIKDAVDPNGILSPGKCGIWPKRMRKATA
ncbi:MAG: FAD-binding oxidoreductase [Candidatus Acidiferrales bacterium]